MRGWHAATTRATTGLVCETPYARYAKCSPRRPCVSPQVGEARALRDKLNKNLKKALKQSAAEAEAARAAEAVAKEKAS